MYIQKSIEQYLRELAGRQPVPGGGSAIALSGALGIALLEMVCNFTIGNKEYNNFEKDIDSYLVSLKKLRQEFMQVIDEDAKVYSSIQSAFKTKDEKSIDSALKEGYAISLKICQLAKLGMDIALDLPEKGNSNLITDVGCGAELLKSSFNSGVFNARINLKGIKDNIFVEKECLALGVLEKEKEDLYKRTVVKVNKKL